MRRGMRACTLRAERVGAHTRGGDLRRAYARTTGRRRARARRARTRTHAHVSCAWRGCVWCARVCGACGARTPRRVRLRLCLINVASAHAACVHQRAARATPLRNSDTRQVRMQWRGGACERGARGARARAKLAWRVRVGFVSFVRTWARRRIRGAAQRYRTRRRQRDRRARVRTRVRECRMNFFATIPCARRERARVKCGGCGSVCVPAGETSMRRRVRRLRDVGSETSARRRRDVGETSARRRRDVGETSARRTYETFAETFPEKFVFQRRQTFF